MTLKFVNRAWMLTATTGTGPITLGGAKFGYLSFAQAGVANTNQVRYCIVDNGNFEIGLGTYSSTGPSLSRDTVLVSRNGGAVGTTKIALSGTAEVFLTSAAEDNPLLGSPIATALALLVLTGNANKKFQVNGTGDGVQLVANDYFVDTFFNASPTASQVIIKYVFPVAVSFAANFAGYAGHVGTNPAASFAMDVQKNGVSVGTITISTGGAFTLVTSGAVAFAVGDRLSIIAPATPDASIAKMALTLKGSY